MTIGERFPSNPDAYPHISHKHAAHYKKGTFSPGPIYHPKTHTIESSMYKKHRTPAFDVADGDFMRPTQERPLPLDRSTWLYSDMKKITLSAGELVERRVPHEMSSPGPGNIRMMTVWWLSANNVFFCFCQHDVFRCLC